MLTNASPTPAPNGGAAPRARERRADPRTPCFRSGLIKLQHQDSTFDCLVRNVSGFGAKIETGAYIAFPKTFELRLDPTDPRMTCKIIWQKQNAVGVMFQSLGGASRKSLK